ncbi:hypothetical protein H6G20_09445 [Desertifilum sp. FACHB-1129]|uniref:Uncharacterized protein n=1 Tax=Desertifilum tharense IPPAS B-1220 TaxID=1781255 RepID=A0A1E5QQA8_9CYAN|nr:MULTISPECIES: hypothetical protein [Desertifilum]MDA0209227.1 hypothetical protein [Cyanobacteria bacterium FC1]MBD2311881.1 hypothetical protein [Desertifilum sp. FACHB-1129]MBD2323025.1 hypothetical protein [Desertifilum sp. FACHB-866]MBD2333456.1 hypothetical protein [Desertifilum sp. FACHB-868]OEJ76865.1 hypothetical protein BH720_02495 [Desertifilum tharense IPPAS B-1220]
MKLHYLKLILSAVIFSLAMQMAQAAKAENLELSFSLHEAERVAAASVQSSVGLDFSVPVYQATPPAQTEAHPAAAAVVTVAEPSEPQKPQEVAQIPDEWWEKGSDSPLAIAIGAAEGTRQPDGTKNSAYYWHTDPGNGANNFGTFSYQHLSDRDTQAVRLAGTTADKQLISAKNNLPEKADRYQLQRLKAYHEQLRSQASAKNLTLNQAELVNGLDLANQSPAAGLYPGGYIDRLAQMKQLVEDPEEQIKEARVWSYWDMDRNRWDAPGLGNQYESIRHDQERRYQQIKLALEEGS